MDDGKGVIHGGGCGMRGRGRSGQPVSVDGGADGTWSRRAFVLPLVLVPVPDTPPSVHGSQTCTRTVCRALWS